METQHIANLVILARKGLSVISEQLPPYQAKAAWEAIEVAEEKIKEFQEDNEKKTHK